ncbi:MAG: class I SAM-dependent RNA methyltransferase [Gemmatimonadota bacterium]|nr:class I SAM-dependent RNA methyltransferase [Gemmatimonadota bacterium]
MTHDTVEVEIRDIAAGGDGVGRTDGLVVFAPRTAPGDRIRASIARGKRFARATRVEILRASADRVAPVCAHYERDACGGCQLQHLSYDAQRAAKAGMIRDAFVRIGRRATELPPVRHSWSPWRYRTKLTLALRRAEGRWIAGLHRYDDPGAVFPLEDCAITDERVMAAWDAIMAHAEWLPPADALRASVRLLDGGAGFVVEGGRAWPDGERLLAAVPALSAIWWIPAETRGRRLVAARDEGLAHGASFAQVNPRVAGQMREYVLALVRTHGPRRVVDAYAGIGDTAEAVARAGARVTAIELDRDAVRACAARLPAGSRAMAGRVEHLLPQALPADLIVLNPPRAGVAPEVTRALEGAAPRPSAIIYVSCDPATLARDVSRLPSFRVASLTAFDMFPQTAHVETVCELRPEEMAA